MSTAVPAPRATTPELVEGQHLDQEEFHRRYEAMPPGVKAELIDGVVTMPSPVGNDHGDAQGEAMAWLVYYATETPGVKLSGEITTILDSRSEPQPDAALRIRPEFGGQTVIDKGYIRGAPELVIEIAKATRSIDLGPKLAVYERAGVREYVVRAIEPDEVLCFRQAEGKLRRVAPDADGLYRSAVFPGLWLDPAALLTGDLKRLSQVVDQGVATPEHAAFVARLEGNRATTP
jgi:Uma2 family endonuclease